MVKQALCLTVLLAIAASAAYARGLFDSEAGFLWELSCDGGSVIITGYTGSNTAIWIPPRIQGLPVTGIGDYAFSDEGQGGGFVQARRQFTSVTIPGTVQRIGAWAFADNLLASVSIGGNVDIRWDGLFCYRDLFGTSFADFYESHGRRAGTYTHSGGVWSVEFR